MPSTGIKCRHCTRLIHLTDGGKTWERVNRSKSQPSRPNSRCMNNRYGINRNKHEPPFNWYRNSGTGIWERRSPEKIPEIPRIPRPAPKGPMQPKPKQAGISHPVPESMVLPIQGAATCTLCNQPISLCWDGQWTEDQREESPGEARICGCPDPELYEHAPMTALMSFCPNAGCRLPAGDCVHGNGIQYPATAIRSGVWFGRWLTQRCCEKCWLAEELDEENTHCKMCPCCDCPCTRNGSPPLRCGLPSRDILIAGWLEEADLIRQIEGSPFGPGSQSLTSLFPQAPPGKFEYYGGQIRYVEAVPGQGINHEYPQMKIQNQEYVSIDWPSFDYWFRSPGILSLGDNRKTEVPGA